MLRIICIYVVAVLCLLSIETNAAVSRDQIEQSLKSQKKLLLQAKYAPKKGMNARGITFTLATLKSHELYLKSNADGKDYVFIGSDGTVQGMWNGKLTGKGELFISRTGGALFLDDRAFPFDPAKWDVFWAAKKATKPRIQKIEYPERRMMDDFMRKSLLKDSLWKVSSGKWRLMQHGGGMAVTSDEKHSYQFQRAVNPFSVLGSGSGFLTYGEADWINSQAEARFFFGKPKLGKVPDWRSMPTSDLAMAFGEIGKRLVSFGWDVKANAFIMKQRTGTGQWQVLWTMEGPRPPITNWVRIGLAIRNGCIAQAWLDGAMVHEASLGRRIAGPFHLGCGEGIMEVDDVRAWSLPTAPQQGHPVFVQSRQFAGKREKAKSDPEEFVRWARGTDTFIRKREDIDDTWFRATIITRMPMMGDFQYESLPYHKDAGELQPGLYEFQILRKDPGDPLNLDKLQVVKSLKFMRLEDGWVSNDLEGMDEENPQFTLRFRRRAADGDRISVQINDKYIPITDKVSGPVHFAIVRRLPRGNSARFPKPWHHYMTCNNLTNELFEAAPTDWNWLEGAFRMDTRWACQAQWNFMACGSTGVPALISKRKFYGAQEHEFFASLRPAMPWDAGDKVYKYDPDADRSDHFRILRREDGFYNRHDINFSFCFDGKNLLSGYSVLFAAFENSGTILMRKGKIVARSTRKFPTDPSFSVVHHLWLDLRIYKYGGLVRVLLGTEKLLEYDDPEPLEGGHIAYWSVRNAISFSRSISVAERVEYVPNILYVDNDVPSKWKPPFPDAVHLTRTKDKQTRVTNRMGSGFFAVRQKLTTPVDLRKTPILELPLKLGPGTKVNVHLKIGKRSYLIDTGAPTKRIKSLLTTDYEKGEQFRVKAWDRLTLARRMLVAAAPVDGIVRVNLLEALKRLNVTEAPLLTEIAVGNTSNFDYLLAGNGGNAAGSYYDVGEPRFTKE